MHVHLVLLADLCLDESLDFVLGHALYMKAIHGGKNKDDRIDSEKIAERGLNKRWAGGSSRSSWAMV